MTARLVRWFRRQRLLALEYRHPDVCALARPRNGRAAIRRLER